MTHTPPVPAGNTSPYPINEAPHDHAPTPPKPPVAKREESAPNWPVLAGAIAVGAGLVGGLIYALSGSAATPAKRKAKAKGKRRQPAKD